MAGELIASAVVEEIVSKLSSWLGSELRLLWNLKKDLQAIKTTLESIEAVLYDAENKSLNERSVCLWLKRLKAAAYDIEDMLDQFQTQNRFFYFPIMAHRLKGVRKRLDGIDADRRQYNLIAQVATQVVTDQQQTTEGRATFSAMSKDEVLGRDQEAEEIINKLLMSTVEASTAFSIISIVGIGGLGKTTLAKLIFNDDRMKVFETKIWIHAMDFEKEKLAEAIISSAGTENGKNLGNLQSKVKKIKEILDGKKFLIVLDDVWNEDEQKWEDFKPILPGGKFGSRIIVTTRSERVTSIMGAQTSHKLKPLSNKACLELFKQRAFGPTGRAGDNHLLSIAEEIVEKCHGVPLTAKTLGGMLHFRSGEAAWKKVRDSEFWQLNEADGGHASEKKITSFLDLSYQHMPSPLKRCFVYSSFYPKAFMLDKDMLIQQWIAQRFIQTEDVIEAKGIGEDYVKYLLAISFLEEIKPTFFYYESHVNQERKTYMKMHDLVYDLARSVAGDEVSVLEDTESTTIYPKECRYASIIWDYPKLKNQKAFMCKVRALSFQRCSPPKKIFSWAKCLRVLDFNHRCFDRLPTLIYKLKQLRYLSISGDAGEIDKRIGKLWKLESLILSNKSTIHTLPVSIGKLCNLIYLDLSNCSNLSELPDSIGSLNNLRSLNVNSCRYLQSIPESLRNLVNLRTLDIRECVMLADLPEAIYNMTHLEIQREEPLQLGPDRDVKLYLITGPPTEYVVRNLADAQRINLKERGNIKSLIYSCSNEESWANKLAEEAMMEELLPHQNLQEFCTIGFNGSNLPKWMSCQMETFHPYLIRNTRGVSFNSLKRLELNAMPNLEEWVTVDEERGVPLFPCLEYLKIDDCPRLLVPYIPPSVKELELERSTLPLFTLLVPYMQHYCFLKHLRIYELEDLLFLPEIIRHFTSLENFTIRNCTSLANLPEWLGELSSLQSLEIDDCPLIDCLPQSIQQLTELTVTYHGMQRNLIQTHRLG